MPSGQNERTYEKEKLELGQEIFNSATVFGIT